MPDLPVPPSPAEQIALRRHLEDLLDEWDVRYRHEDRFWESNSGGEAVYGWGTRIERNAGRAPVHVWFDGLDDDIALWRGGGKDWREWQDLTDLPAVLRGVTAALREMLDTSTSTSTSTRRGKWRRSG